MFGSPTPVTKTSLRDTPIYLILWVPFLPIGWELCVPVRTLHTRRNVASVQVSVASHSSQPIKRYGTHKYCRSTASGNDFPDR